VKTKIQPAATVVVCAAIAALAACSPLAPQPDRTEYYVLSPIGAANTATASSVPAGELSIGLGPINFPGYLKRPEVVTRSAPNKLEVSDQNRWGEPLDQDFARVLSEDLAELLGTQRIYRFPRYANSRIDYQVEVQVLSFETSTDRKSQLVATWTIRNPKDGRELYTGQSSFSNPVEKGDVGPSAALSSDLASLSKEIAAQVRILASQPSKPAAGAGVTS
jgi:uncharacterized protein